MNHEIVKSPGHYGNAVTMCDRCQQEKGRGTLRTENFGTKLDILDPKLFESMIAQALVHERMNEGHIARVIEFQRGV